MKIATKLGLAAAFSLFVAQAAGAQSADTQSMSAPPSEGMGHMGHMGHMGGMHDGSFMMLLKSADLTAAQHAQLRQILESEKAQMKGVNEKFHALHEQIAEKLLAPGTINASDLAPLEQKMFHYQQQIDQSMVDTALSIRNILTTDQLNHLSKVHQQLQNLHSQIQSLMGSDQGGAGDESN
jgi:Spy/CpxP family protein refolding chaperone